VAQLNSLSKYNGFICLINQVFFLGVGVSDELVNPLEYGMISLNTAYEASF